MGLVDKIANFFIERQYKLYLLLFIIAASLFTYLQFDATFADPDSFYHAKMAQVLAQKGAITEFPWLSATTLKYNFIDHHFLYHLALIPFVKLFSPLIGLKIATIIFASLAMVTIFWFLRQLKIRGAFWYVLFLLTINPFIFRLNLAKAQQLVLIFLFLFIYLLFNRRYLGLILISCFYVWLYAGWPLLLLLVLIYAIINWFWAIRYHNWLVFRWRRFRVCQQNILLSFSVGLGLLAGLFFNPYFPKDLGFYWQQSFKIAVLNYQHLIGVGGEWYPYKLLDLFLAAMPFFVFFIIALITFGYLVKKQPMNSWFFLSLSILFFALTLKSRRYVEYFIPLAVCFSALSLNSVIDLIKNQLKKFIPRQLILLLPFIVLLILSPVFIQGLGLVKESYQQGFAFDKFQEPAEWLNQHSLNGDIVFHSDWDEFPILFYHNDKNYYIAGLDPTFMYFFDPDLYQRWVDITTGSSADNFYSVIKNLFGARYVFVDINQNSAFDRNLANNFNFLKVFENQEARIYQLSD